MKIHLENHSPGYLIQGYGEGEIRVLGPATSGGAPTLTTHRKGVVVSPERLLSDWGPEGALEPAHLAPFAELDAEVILLGLSAHRRPLAPSLLASLIALGIGFEVMDTGAACRTYNILAAEGRRVAAALLID